MTYTYSSATTIHTGEWKHFTGVYDGRTTKIYIDGVDTGLADTSQSGNIAYPQLDYTGMLGGWFVIGAYQDTNEYWVRSLGHCFQSDCLIDPQSPR